MLRQEMNKTIIFCDNDLKHNLNFRGDVISYFHRAGWKVVIVVPKKSINPNEKISVDDGIDVIMVDVEPNGINPLKDIRYLCELRKIYSSYNPSIIFHYTVKPNIYGTFAAKSLGIKSVVMLAGLGYVFVGDSFPKKIGRLLYKCALSIADKVLVLNRQNLDYLLSHKYVRKESEIRLLRGGEGVSLTRFPFVDKSYDDIHFLMIARILFDKGYSEYVEAARIVKKRYPDIKICLLGPMALDSPMGVPKAVIEKDVADGIIDYLGVTSDVPSYLKENAIVVVPSHYPEGLNRALIEGCAMGCPCIATDIPGCREVIDEDSTGYLVPIHDPEKLADAMIRYIEMPKEKRVAMSVASRRKALSTFDVENVIQEYAGIIDELAK